MSIRAFWYGGRVPWNQSLEDTEGQLYNSFNLKTSEVAILPYAKEGKKNIANYDLYYSLA